MKRLIYLVPLAFLVGCNGMGSSGSTFVPTSPNGIAAAGAARLTPGAAIADGRRQKTKVLVTLTIPHRHRRHGAVLEHPSTISASTQSFGISVNGATQQVFNTTPTSPGCSIGASGTVCTFSINAAVGSDTLTVTTYSATNGGGSPLDKGTAVVNIVRGTANAPQIRLGPVVSTTADSGVGSLRNAIGSASAGDTILFMVPANSTITLTTPITVGNRVSIAGPGVSASARRGGGKHSNTTYTGLSISGGNTQQLFLISAGATMTISGLILTSGNAAVAHSPGGLIHNLGTLSLVDDTLTASTSTVATIVRAPRHKTHASRHPGRQPQHSAMRHPNVCPPGNDTYGGAVYNNGTLAISGSTFDGNTAPSSVTFGCQSGYGGAIYNDSYGIVTSTGDTYVNNAAEDGGAIYNEASYGQVTITSDLFSANLGCTAATNCPTSGCSSPSSGCTTYAMGDGGAIYDEEGPGVSITGSTFSNNGVGPGADGSGDGGALYLDSGSPTVTTSSFTGNFAGGGTTNCASGEGGAIYHGSNTMQLDNDTFSSNYSGGDESGEGGAIYSDETIQGSGDTFASNYTFASGSACSANGTAYGGAIDGDYISLSGTAFTGNVATAAHFSEGGAIYLDDQSKLSGDTFTSNQAIGTGVGPIASSAYGGALYADDSLTLSSSSFASNTAAAQGTLANTAEGGALYNDSTLGSSNNGFTGNKATGAGTTSDAYGGAVYNDSSFSSNGDSFKTNSATATGESDGGGVDTEYTMVMFGATFVSNSTSAPHSYGGGLYTDESGNQVINSVFTSNTATAPSAGEGYGGGIYDEDGLTVSADVISGNTALNRGGGLYADDTDLVTNSTISGNVVSAIQSQYDGGGGIYNDDTLTLVNSTVSGNSVTLSAAVNNAGGGGIYDYDGMSVLASTISGNVVTGTAGTNSGGGGIYDYDNDNITNSTISGNRSSGNGGGYGGTSSYTTPMINDTIYQNTATGPGGNINVPAGFTVELYNTIVAAGTSSTGPDINNLGTLTSYDYNLVQTAVTGTAMTGTTAHNLPVGTNPLLLALSNNGGPTFTMAEQATSPTRAVIPFAANECNAASANTNVDQRGFTRGTATAGKCDIGAFEFGGNPSAARRAPKAAAVHGGHHPHRHLPRHPRPQGAHRR